MARSKEFDREHVLRKAVSTFRARGFEGASIQVLVDEMGIHRASLYDTYGSKEQLFRLALEAYEGLAKAASEAHLTAPGPARVVLDRFFGFVARELTATASGRDCCLMLRAALSGARELGGVQEHVRQFFDWFAGHFERLVARARSEGQIASPRPDAELAEDLRQLLLGCVAGAAVDSDPERLERNAGRSVALVLGH